MVTSRPLSLVESAQKINCTTIRPKSVTLQLNLKIVLHQNTTSNRQLNVGNAKPMIIVVTSRLINHVEHVKKVHYIILLL